MLTKSPPLRVSKRPLVLTSLVAVGSVVAVLFSGCIFAAVHTARFIERKINPPQPVLLGSTLFFNGTIKVSGILRSTEGRRRMKEISADEDPDEATQDAAPTPADTVKPRMTLRAIVTNVSGATMEVSLVTMDSPLGTMLSAPHIVALGAGQRWVLGPLRSAHDGNFETLTIIVGMKRGDVVEKHDLSLGPISGKAEEDER